MGRGTPTVQQSGGGQQERPGTYGGNATRPLRPCPNPVDQFEVRVVARTLPGRQFEVGRILRVRISIALREAGITVPAVLVETDS